MAAICPVCKRSMVPLQVGRIEIDFCRNGCKGLWFDVSELPALEVPTREITAALAEAFQAPPHFRLPAPLQCPQCNRHMVTRAYRGTGIAVDYCEACGGHFLDAGELQAIQEMRGIVALGVPPASLKTQRLARTNTDGGLNPPPEPPQEPFLITLFGDILNSIFQHLSSRGGNLTPRHQFRKYKS